MTEPPRFSQHLFHTDAATPTGILASRQPAPAPHQAQEHVTATVNKLRELRNELKKDNWKFEAPRHTLR